MFLRLTDFGYPRSALNALGFYISYFALIVIIGMIIGVLLRSFMPQYPIHEARMVTTTFTVLATVGLSLLILQSKNRNTSIPLLFLALFSAVMASVGGAALGLLVPTLLTTLGSPKRKRKK